MSFRCHRPRSFWRVGSWPCGAERFGRNDPDLALQAYGQIVAYPFELKLGPSWQRRFWGCSFSGLRGLPRTVGHLIVSGKVAARRETADFVVSLG